MFNHPVEILCSPILIPQGLYTKWKTPRLKEADGLRAGKMGSGQPLKLLITGDSAAAGVGADLQQDALSGQLVQLLQQHYQCDWALHAKSGFSTADLYQHLSQLADATQAFDMAIISIGVNDVTKPLSLKKWQSQLQDLHQLLRTKFAVKYVIYTAVPPMHYFPALPQPLRYFLGKTAKNMNQKLNKMYNNKQDSTVLSVEFPFEPEFMARDGFHPSPKAYQLWAMQASALIQQQYPHLSLK